MRANWGEKRKKSCLAADPSEVSQWHKERDWHQNCETCWKLLSFLNCARNFQNGFTDSRYWDLRFSLFSSISPIFYFLVTPVPTTSEGLLQRSWKVFGLRGESEGESGAPATRPRAGQHTQTTNGPYFHKDGADVMWTQVQVWNWVQFLSAPFVN